MLSNLFYSYSPYYTQAVRMWWGSPAVAHRMMHQAAQQARSPAHLPQLQLRYVRVVAYTSMRVLRSSAKHEPCFTAHGSSSSWMHVA